MSNHRINKRLEQIERRCLQSRDENKPPPPGGRLDRTIRHGATVIEVWRVPHTINPSPKPAA